MYASESFSPVIRTGNGMVNRLAMAQSAMRRFSGPALVTLLAVAALAASAGARKQREWARDGRMARSWLFGGISDRRLIFERIHRLAIEYIYVCVNELDVSPIDALPSDTGEVFKHHSFNKAGSGLPLPQLPFDPRHHVGRKRNGNALPLFCRR